jgi:hypothetical protein
MFSQQRGAAPQQPQQAFQPQQRSGGPAPSPSSQPLAHTDVLRHVPITAKGGIPLELQIPLQPPKALALGRNELCLHSGEVVDMVINTCIPPLL